MAKIKSCLAIILTVFGCSAIFTGGCRADSSGSNGGAAPSDQSLTVSAAISLKDAFREIGEIYRARSGRTVSFNFGGSGALQRQIETGAPVDLFASAGEKQMNELADRNLIDAATRRDFARNRLVLIVPSDSPGALASFTDLTRPEVRKIAAGNPKTVPAGQYTEQVFENLKLTDAVRSKLILAEDVRQVLDYVVRGETDAGIVYETDARAAQGQIRVAAVAAENTHAPILYPVAIIGESRNKPAAREFLELVLSAEGQRILQKHGFTAVS